MDTSSTSFNTNKQQNQQQSQQQNQQQSTSNSNRGNQSDSDSHTEGKPSPQALPRLAPAARQSTPSTETDGSSSPTRSKKRAIATMLDGDEDKECIVVEKQAPPPLPKRQIDPPMSPISPTHSTRSPPASPGNTYLDHPLYTKDDDHYDVALKLLQGYRDSDGILENGAPILDFFDQWIKESKVGLICVADALFELLLETYEPATDVALISRIPLIMTQILQRKYNPLNPSPPVLSLAGSSLSAFPASFRVRRANPV
jgi:hypothetical protein